MAEQLKADIGGIDGVRSQIAESFLSIKKKQEQLQELIRALNEMWEGEAHDTFYTSCQSAYQRLEAVHEEGMKILAFEEKAAAEYGKADIEALAQVTAL